MLALIVCLIAQSNPARSATTSLSTLDAGGNRVASAHYVMDSSFSSIAGTAGANSPAVTVKRGFIGQLYEMKSLQLEVLPAAVSELSNAQLNAIAALDDGTMLPVPGSYVNWTSAGFPIGSIDASGLITPSPVYTNTYGTVSGYCLGASNTIAVLVLDEDPDNFGIYANDTIPDAWQVRYFGENNPTGLAPSDPDRDGHSNLDEFLAGTDPTNSSSTLRITDVRREGGSVRLTWTCVGGHSYVVQSTKAAAISAFNTNFMDVALPISVPGDGESTTNYLDLDAACAPRLPAPGGLSPTNGSLFAVLCCADSTRGLADSLGAAIPEGSLVMLGTFDISEATIQTNFEAANLTAIMTAFTPYTDPFAVGDETGLPASWCATRNATGFRGDKIYLLAVDKPTLSAATHLGIFSAPLWALPATGDSINIDLQDATEFIVGSHGGPLTVNSPGDGQPYMFGDTARLSVLPGRILFYRVRLVP